MSCCRSNKPPSDGSEPNGSNAINSCKECIEFLIDYLDGTLPQAKRVEFELHLELCPPCDRYLQQYRTTIRLGQEAMKERVEKSPPPEALVRAIMAAMHGGKPGEKRAESGGESGPSGGCGCTK